VWIHILRQMTPRSRAKPHCMHLFASGVSVWILGSWLDKTGVSSVFRHSSLKRFYQKRGNCRHPILYLPKSGILGLDDDTILSITIQLRIMSPRKRFGKAHKSKPKPKHKPRERMHLPSGVCIFKNAYATQT
jgi:hypothetical protein